MSNFYCQPCNINKDGFYFNDVEELEKGLSEVDFKEYRIVCIDYPHEYLFKSFYDGINFLEVVEFLSNLKTEEEIAVKFLAERGCTFEDAREMYTDVQVFTGIPENHIHISIIGLSPVI